MNKGLFHQANMMVMAGDYETALRLYQATLSDDESLEPGDKGLLHHRIGNCYTKMKKLSIGTIRQAPIRITMPVAALITILVWHMLLCAITPMP